MGMSLTEDDLLAIKHLVDGSIDERVPVIIKAVVQPMLDEAIDKVMRQTAAGFAEVHEKFDAVDRKFHEVNGKIDGQSVGQQAIQDTVQRVEQVQRAEIDRVDQQSTMIASIRKTLNAV